MFLFVNRIQLGVIATALILAPIYAHATPPTHPARTFTAAKKEMYKEFSTNRVTLYCGCKFNSHKEVNLSGCGYQYRKNLKRASRTEAEHIVAASSFGNTRACWREPLCTKSNGTKYKGRKCCQKIDKDYRMMENDLHNLWPAVGEVNGDRSDYSFRPLPEVESPYGQCKFKVDFKARKAEPTDISKGIVARAYLYMQETYNVNLSDSQEKLFLAWNKQFPPSEWEYQWNQKVSSFQGNDNDFISNWGRR